MNDLSKILDVFRKQSSFLLASHCNPEGDNIGSELALASLLGELGKKTYIRNQDPVPANLTFLSGSENISNDLANAPAFEVAVVLDCGALGRVGEVESLVKKGSLIINIDHHLGNTGFGDLNYVNPEAAAVGEMIADFFSPLGIRIGKERATCLYTAIVTDTGNFQYRNTGPRTHETAAMLLREGIDPFGVSEKIFQARPISACRLLGLVLSDVKLSKDGRIAWSSVSREMLRRVDAGANDTEGFVEELRSIRGVEVAVLFREAENGQVRISLRSRGGFDVNAIAQELGGGGHLAAAGCTITGELASVVERVTGKVREKLPSL